MESYQGRGYAHINFQAHQGPHTTEMNGGLDEQADSRAARAKCSPKGEILSSFSLPNYVTGTTLQFSHALEGLQECHKRERSFRVSLQRKAGN